MVMPTADWHPHVVVEYFHPIPSLTDLELFYSNPDDEADDDLTPFRTFLEVLGGAENFLPHLRDLTLWAYFSEREDYIALISALERRVRLGHCTKDFGQELAELETVPQLRGEDGRVGQRWIAD
jgi:hypothetical protein